MEKTKESKKRLFWIILTIIINVGIVSFIAIKEIISEKGNASKIAFSDINYIYLGLGVLCLLISILFEHFKYHRLIMVTSGKVDGRGALNTLLVGRYYDNITPFGVGGQPFQIHYLISRGYSGGAASATTVGGFLTTQIAFVIVGLVVFIANNKVLGSLDIIKWVAYVGLFMYMLVPLMIIFFLIMPKTFEKICSFFIRILTKIKVIKKPDEATQKIEKTLDNYVYSIKAISRRPFLMIGIFLASIIYQVAIMSIPFFMIRAFGGESDWWTIFSITVYIYSAITIIPTPGNSGIAEGSFYSVFKSLTGGYLFWAMICWRILVYFSWIIFGIIVVTRSAVHNKRKKKKEVPKDRPLKVALFIDIFYPDIDGVIKCVDAYAREITKKGGYVCVFCPLNRKGYVDTDKYEVVRTSSFRIRSFNVAIGLPFVGTNVKKKFKEVGFDLVHVHSPFGLGHIGVTIANRYNIPVVASFHSKYYDDAMNITHSKPLARQFVNMIVDFYCKCDYVWACSRTTKETLAEYGYKGEISVMENGVDHLPQGDYNELKENAKKEFSIPEGRKILLFVGQQIWQKNLKTVLDTTRLIVDRDPSFITIIVGTGYNEKEIKKYASKLGLEDFVIFTGRISSRKLLAGVYYNSNLFFFPSLYDNAPIVLREAALAGVPALLVKGSSSAEIVEDNVNGYLIENNPEYICDRVLDILSDEKIEEYMKVREKARETIPVTWDIIVDKVLDNYVNLDSNEE